MGELLWVLSSFIGLVREKTDGKSGKSSREEGHSIATSKLTGLWMLCNAVTMSCFRAASCAHYGHLHLVSVSVHSLIFLKSSKLTSA